MYELTATLSGGQRQRVAIARMLVQEAAIVLADEPISSLDPERSRETMDLLCKLNKEFEKTIIVSCHSIVFAQTHFDRVIGIKNGKVCLDREARSLSGELLVAVYGDSSGVYRTAEESGSPSAAGALQ
jgi:phosphonate transport system ATP-binding protein